MQQLEAWRIRANQGEGRLDSHIPAHKAKDKYIEAWKSGCARLEEYMS